MRSVEVGGSRVHVLGIVKGLVSEEAKVVEAAAQLSPDVFGLSISKEQLAALRSKAAWDDYELSPLESAYQELMECFGQVRLPSPAFVKALELADASGIPIIPVDMNDEDYTETYCRNVGGLDLVREGAFSRGLRRRRFDGSSPEALAVDWDRRVNRAKGFRQLEEERERHMALALRRMASRYRNILALLDFERSEGVARLLDRD
jgi:hypothetical protein